MPHDHDELIAMLAPRAIVAMGNQDDEWLGDESGWKSINGLDYANIIDWQTPMLQ